MELSKTLLSELQNRLKVANRKSPLLNAEPGKSKNKIDVSNLDVLRDGLGNKLLTSLLSKKEFSFEISAQNSPKTSKKDKQKQTEILDKFNQIIIENEIEISEQGKSSLGFGFPLVIKRDSLDINKLIVAPLFIWPITLSKANKVNSYTISKTKTDDVILNDVLKNHLFNELDYNLDLDISKYINNEDNKIFTPQKLATACTDFVSQINKKVAENTFDFFLNEITNLSFTEINTEALIEVDTDAIISFSGVISSFNVQKQAVIDDYEILLNSDSPIKINQNNPNPDWYAISSQPLDPSQQGILNAIGDGRNLVIQGPPGTGKSRTLTAILVNALENGKKTLVVCEKKTAIDVLMENLERLDLATNSILIRDTMRDREKVVDSMNQKIKGINHNTEAEHEIPLSESRGRVLKAIDILNKNHELLEEKLYGDYNWSDAVVEFLEMKRLNIPEVNIQHVSCLPEKMPMAVKELGILEPLYKKVVEFGYSPFLKPNIFSSENPYQLEQEVLSKFRNYRAKLIEIKHLSKKISKNPLHKVPRFLLKHFTFIKRVKNLYLEKDVLDIKEQMLVSQVKQDGLIQLYFPKDLLNANESYLYTIRMVTEEAEVYVNQPEAFIAEYNYVKRLLESKNAQSLIASVCSTSNWSLVAKYNLLRINLLNHANIHMADDTSFYDNYKSNKADFDANHVDFIKEQSIKRSAEAVKNFCTQHPTMTAESVYNKRKSKKYKRLSIKEMIAFDPEFFTTMFPIVFATPEVASSLFPSDAKQFDILMLDEASQLRVENILPCFLKAKQLIISGDEHQMPPSNYFLPIIEGMVVNKEEETPKIVSQTDLLLSTASILEFAGEVNFDENYLNFHYRSKHPLLIEFSNQAFYGGRLNALPARKDYTPIEYIPVNGTLHNRMNEEEAESVLDLLKSYSSIDEVNVPSIGVATFNAPQRDLILKKIDDLKLNDQSWFQKFSLLEKKGLFIKNLENIQGEERDVIIISSTFGDKKDGNFKEAFGPINQNKGYKLLNVIVTRAKEQIHVCCSIPEQYIAKYKEDLAYTQANNKRGILYAYLAYAKAVSGKDEQAIEDVLESLKKHSFSTNEVEREAYKSSSKYIDYKAEELSSTFPALQKNISFGGYEVDIIDEENKVIYDCDGTSFKNSDVAYLYDIHNEKILTSLGYKYKRFFSYKDWKDKHKLKTNNNQKLLSANLNKN